MCINGFHSTDQLIFIASQDQTFCQTIEIYKKNYIWVNNELMPDCGIANIKCHLYIEVPLFVTKNKSF